MRPRIKVSFGVLSFFWRINTPVHGSSTTESTVIYSEVYRIIFQTTNVIGNIASQPLDYPTYTNFTL